MKGVIFAALREVVEADGGPAAWSRLCGSAGVPDAHADLGSYPDADVLALVRAYADLSGATPEDAARQVGRGVLPALAHRHPEFLAVPDDADCATFEVLRTLDHVIHPAVFHRYPGSHFPSFRVDVDEPGRLLLAYGSDRGMCHFAEGMVAGLAARFGDDVVVDQPACRLRGDPECLLLAVRRG